MNKQRSLPAAIPTEDMRLIEEYQARAQRIGASEKLNVAIDKLYNEDRRNELINASADKHATKSIRSIKRFIIFSIIMSLVLNWIIDSSNVLLFPNFGIWIFLLSTYGMFEKRYKRKIANNYDIRRRRLLTKTMNRIEANHINNCPNQKRSEQYASSKKSRSDLAGIASTLANQRPERRTTKDIYRHDAR